MTDSPQDDVILAEGARVAPIEALKDKDSDVRGRAVWVLGKIGPEAKAAVPALIEALKDEEEHIRRNAAEARKRIQKRKQVAESE